MLFLIIIFIIISSIIFISPFFKKILFTNVSYNLGNLLFNFFKNLIDKFYISEDIENEIKKLNFKNKNIILYFFYLLLQFIIIAPISFIIFIILFCLSFILCFPVILVFSVVCIIYHYVYKGINSTIDTIVNGAIIPGLSVKVLKERIKISDPIRLFGFLEEMKLPSLISQLNKLFKFIFSLFYKSTPGFVGDKYKTPINNNPNK